MPPSYTQVLGFDCRVRVPGTPTALTDEATTPDAQYKVYQITDPTKQVLDPTAPITVKKNGTTVTSGYTIDRLFGKVKFSSPLQPSDTVTITGQYLPMADAAQAYQFTLTSNVLGEESTVFGQKYVSREVVGRDHSVSFTQWLVVDNDWIDKLQADNIVVVEIKMGAGIRRMWAVIAADEISGQVRSLQSEALQFQGTQDADGRVISYGG